MTDALQSATSTATASASKGSEKWDAMTGDQKKTTFDALPSEQKKGKTYYEWITEGYYHQYENWMPWIEDQYLRWFTRDNKASYATKEHLDKSKITGIEQVDTLQDGVHGVFAGQMGKGGMLQPIGDAVSKEGVNRAERAGKDEKGSYGAAAGIGNDGMMGKVMEGTQSAGGAVWKGAKSAGGYVGGVFGRGEEGGK